MNTLTLEGTQFHNTTGLWPEVSDVWGESDSGAADRVAVHLFEVATLHLITGDLGVKATRSGLFLTTLEPVVDLGVRDSFEIVAVGRTIKINPARFEFEDFRGLVDHLDSVARTTLSSGLDQLSEEHVELFHLMCTLHDPGEATDVIHTAKEAERGALPNSAAFAIAKSIPGCMDALMSYLVRDAELNAQLEDVFMPWSNDARSKIALLALAIAERSEDVKSIVRETPRLFTSLHHELVKRVPGMTMLNGFIILRRMYNGEDI